MTQAGDEMWSEDLVHTNTDHLDTWRGMEECYQLGLTKAIGLSNFNHRQMTRILDSCTVRPANNQIEVHPFLSNSKLVEFCHKNDIVVTAYSPLCGLDIRLGSSLCLFNL